MQLNKSKYEKKLEKCSKLGLSDLESGVLWGHLKSNRKPFEIRVGLEGQQLNT